MHMYLRRRIAVSNNLMISIFLNLPLRELGSGVIIVVVFFEIHALNLT